MRIYIYFNNLLLTMDEKNKIYECIDYNAMWQINRKCRIEISRAIAIQKIVDRKFENIFQGISETDLEKLRLLIER